MIKTVTKFILGRYSSLGLIQSIQIVKETEKTYEYITKSYEGKTGVSRRTKYLNPIYNTFDEAKEVLVQKTREAIDSCERELKSLDAKLGKALVYTREEVTEDH